MRITISHNRSKEEVKRSIDGAFDDLFRGIGVVPVQFADQKRSWQGFLLTFSLSAKMGFLNAPIRGTVDVGDRDVTIDADLGLLERLIASAKVREDLTNKVRALLG